MISPPNSDDFLSRYISYATSNVSGLLNYGMVMLAKPCFFDTITTDAYKIGSSISKSEMLECWIESDMLVMGSSAALALDDPPLCAL